MKSILFAAFLTAGCFAQPAEVKPDTPNLEGELIGPRPMTCREIKEQSDLQVKECKSVCDGDLGCALGVDRQSGKAFCPVGWIRLWKQSRERCEDEFPLFYHPNPTFPPVD